MYNLYVSYLRTDKSAQINYASVEHMKNIYREFVIKIKIKILLTIYYDDYLLIFMCRSMKIKIRYKITFLLLIKTLRNYLFIAYDDMVFFSAI